MSYARGEFRKSSNLDFSMELEPKTFDSYMNLKAFLDDLFKIEVDLVLINAVKPQLREIIPGETVYAPVF